MKPLFMFVCAVAVVSLPKATLAQAPARSIARKLAGMAVDPSYDLTTAGRAAFIATLSDYCSEVLGALPTNTPAEDAWVSSEGKTLDVSKIRRLVASPEFSRRELKEAFSNCVKSTAAIKRTRTGPNRGDSEAHSEASELLGIAFDFNDDADIVAYASRAGLDPEVWQFNFLGAARKSLIVAALRALEGR